MTPVVLAILEADFPLELAPVPLTMVMMILEQPPILYQPFLRTEMMKLQQIQTAAVALGLQVRVWESLLELNLMSSSRRMDQELH